ncbi:MAG: N-acetyltransferase, partial [Nitrososphaeria archaeon]|nr:N-acetyltransferase [Nitrososphaeria archaeon]
SIGQEALRLLMEMIPQKRYLANVSPQNTNSAKFFKKNKFRLIQHTYEYTPSENQ